MIDDWSKVERREIEEQAELLIIEKAAELLKISAEKLPKSEKVGSVPNLFKIVNAVFEMVVAKVEEVNEVAIHNFGVFKSAAKAERKGRNPKTGEEITV